MVVSKDSKRKRKESPPPQPSAVESSPEMPKRTKVQAQRKFAQGQSAPPSSYNSITAASSSSNTGPSTSSESREPPTDILPNKRPKTEDFLTFLCFRGTPALPPHLDFLNQGKGKESAPPPNKKNVAKVVKPAKKGKKGRPKKVAPKPDEPKASTSKSENENLPADGAVNSNNGNDKSPKTAEDNVMPFAVRKRAEVVTEGNRRVRTAADRQLRKAEDTEKCSNNVAEVKRRSNRNGAKEVKQLAGAETDDDEEYFSANDESSKVDETVKEAVAKQETRKSKTPAISERKSETPSKESETGKSRRGRPTSTAKKGKETLKESQEELLDTNKKKSVKKEPVAVQAEAVVKEKVPVKRPRQKESPIFIPSPEPSGRMTRQRAFFEPVKVPHREEEEEEKKKESVDTSKTSDDIKTERKDAQNLKSARNKANKKESDENNIQNDKEKSNLNVFDFSSDDEQPLAKSMKMKKTAKGSPKKAAAKLIKAGKRATGGKNQDFKLDENDTAIENSMEKLPEKTEEVEKEIKDDLNKSKTKRGKYVRKKAEEHVEDDKDLAPPSPKKTTNARQSRKKTKSDNVTVNGDEEKDSSPSAPVRSQRPTRKTKEAAAIYMGIIGHKLQLPDDEEDDLSLNSFPDRPNVKEMEKMEIELKKNASHLGTTTTVKATTSSPSATQKTSPKKIKSESPVPIEKPAGRRGRPPKQAKPPPVKREIEGMLVKKGAITKLAAPVENVPRTDKQEDSKADTDDEDFLLNEEVNETKRKLEKSFSDSDDEPLAIKASVKTNDKEGEQDIHKSENTTQNTSSTPQLMMLPLTTKPVPTQPLSSAQATSASPVTSVTPNIPHAPSPFKTIEKKSPVPTSKILNVPAAYALPSTNPAVANVNATLNSTFNKTSPYLPQASPLYHTSHVRPMAHQFPTAKSPTGPPGPSVGSSVSSHLASPHPSQSPMKYQAAPTTYPPPIEAYPSPKINPNFLTPKFDRASLPRTNNFPSPSPVKFDVVKGALGASSALSAKPAPLGSGPMTVSITATTTPTTSAAAVASVSGVTPSTGASTSAAANQTSNDPLKDEIGSILAANLMPSKEESGKIFGIASVSLAQSSGPDNTKCTLGKCGSVHKPVLGPVVPTEGYIGDQLSSKERRKAKVNMTHEQIQKWLIECSSNPDEIQDDLEDDFDDNLRPNMFATTPPPTRDDKESTSFSSSSKATRDLGKSESAWSAKGPSLKAIPVVATASRKEEGKQLEVTNQTEAVSENERTGSQAISLPQKTNTKQAANATNDTKAARAEKSEKKTDKKLKEDKAAAKESTNNQSKVDKEKEPVVTPGPSSKAATNAGKQSNVAAAQIPSPPEPAPSSTSKPNRKRNITATVAEDKPTTAAAAKTTTSAVANSNAPAAKTPKRTPVYNQKAQQKQPELKVTTTTSHKKATPYSFGAFSADNEKSIYSFDKDDDEADGSKPLAKPAFRRQSQRDSQLEETVPPTTPTSRASAAKKRAAASAAEKANKDIANSSVSLTLSPSENCKLVKVSLDAEKSAATGKTAKKGAAQKTESAPNNDADSDSDGHTFYIPLQGGGAGGEGEGGIQGVAVKLGREGPDGPNQKVIMHATLVTKAQMGSNSKPLPDSMNASDIVKTLIASSQVQTASNVTASEALKKVEASKAIASTSAAAAAASSSPNTTANATSANAAATAAATANSTSNSLKSVPIGTVQPRFKGNEPVASTPTPTPTPAPTTSSGLVRVNSSSSLLSGSAKSRIGASGSGPSGHGVSKKFKDDTPIKMSNNTAFPRHDDPTQMVDAPIFRPTEKEFADPIDFIERITPIAARFGICKIIPPSTFKPECRISDEMRFTAYNQYVHKMLHRWGPSAKELSAIKKYLATQSIVMNHPPWIGGMEVDLPRLYHTVQELGGLKEVIEKKKWARVAEEMCIPKLAQDRVTKLDDIYCKYLLPYDTLSQAERQKLFDEVEADWAKREARARRNADRFVNTESVSNEEDDVSSEDDEESEEEVDGVSMECIVKGRSMALSQFYRIARNTMALWFKNTEPTVNDVEAEFWRHVAVRDSHVCVHSGSIDSSGWGYGFPSPGPKGKGSNYARHPWNLKVLTNNPGSVLRSLGPVMGVTVPTLHVGMLFSACCWYRDPHGLSWIEYLHTGASKLWYGIPDDQSANFRAALTNLIPTHCQNKTIWLPCDTVMVPPHMLTDRGVSLCRIEQKPGEFIVVFPRAYTSSLATGYVVSESVYFATSSWLDSAKDDFRDIHDSCEPAMFSLEQLLFALGYDQRVQPDTLEQMLPMLHEVYEKETAAREQLKAAGVTSTEKVHNEKGSKAKKQQPPFKCIENECDLCRANLYISMVRTEEGNVYCLQHALKNLNNGNIQAKQCKLIYAYNVEDIENLIKNLKEKIQQKRNTSTSKKSK